MAATSPVNGSTNGPVPRPKRAFPEVVLDTTLYDLLCQDCDDDDAAATQCLCNVKPNSETRFLQIPQNKKYLITSSQASDGNDLSHLQLENVSYLLSFWAGRMEVVLIAAEGLTEDESLSVETIGQNAARAFSVLAERQRPIPRVFANADDCRRRLCESRERQVRWGFATDFGEEVPSFVAHELHYKLNSKRWLAECRLRSASDQIIDCECRCPTHKTSAGQWYYGGPACSFCVSAIPNEVARVCQILQDREPPYVLKLTQSLGSVGTTLVRSLVERNQLLDKITGILYDTLPRLTKDNAHIHPTALVLSDFLPGETIALNFFVRRDGSPIFFGACQQLGTRISGGGRQQTSLKYSDQVELEKKYRDVLRQIGQTLHHEGYSGPVGADIMETPDGEQYVIDLNVRTATSLILGLLRGHCERRGFDVSMVFECVLLGIPREELEERLQMEFQQGRIILLGTTRMGKKRKWAYPVVLAGEDAETVKDLSERILGFEAKGGDEAAEEGGA